MTDRDPNAASFHMRKPEPHADDDCETARLPSTAALLSLFLPGTGQLLVRQDVAAGLIFMAWTCGWIYHRSELWIPVAVVASVHAFVYGRRERSRLQDEQLTACVAEVHQPSIPGEQT